MPAYSELTRRPGFDYNGCVQAFFSDVGGRVRHGRLGPR
jgi:hypothetical protein